MCRTIGKKNVAVGALTEQSKTKNIFSFTTLQNKASSLIIQTRIIPTGKERLQISGDIGK